MSTFSETADEFLAQKRIAVAGVSRGKSQAANLIYKTIREKGYQVFPVNPKAQVVEGDVCFPNLKGIPEVIDGVIIVTRPEMTMQLVRECAEAGIARVWMHENAFIGATSSSVSEEAVEFCKENGITIIAGGCPLMFLEFGHKCMRWVMGIMGRLPE